MNIVIIPSAELSYDSGSVIYAKNLFKELIKLGHKVKIISQCVPKDLILYKENIIVKKNLLFHPIIDDREVYSQQFSNMLVDLLDAIKETVDEWGKVDIIHAHYASINSFAAFIANIIYDIPYVISSFGRDINIGYELDERTKNFIDFSYIKASNIIVPESSIKNKLNSLNQNLSEKTSIIPMPFDSAVLCTENCNLSLDKSKLILSTINSCFTSEKGIDTIIRAVHKIFCEYGDIFTLYIAGQDDDEKKVNQIRLNNLIEELGLSNNVKFLGYISRNQVGYLLKCSDVFIDARTKGNFSSVLLEAQIIQTPTISSNNTAAKTIITMGNGLLFEPNNYTELKNKISDLIFNESIYQKIKNNQLKWCEKYGKEFYIESCTEKTIEIFSKAIQSNQSK